MQTLEKLKPFALLLLRSALGVIFIYHGYPKLFGHAQDAVKNFVDMGFPGYFAYLAGVVEFFGGCMLIVGLFTRVAGLFIALVMAVGLWKAHHILLDPLAVRNYELPLVLAVSAFALASLGAGLISFDHALFREGGSAPRRARKKD